MVNSWGFPPVSLKLGLRWTSFKRLYLIGELAFVRFIRRLLVGFSLPLRYVLTVRSLLSAVWYLTLDNFRIYSPRCHFRLYSSRWNISPCTLWNFNAFLLLRSRDPCCWSAASSVCVCVYVCLCCVCLCVLFKCAFSVSGLQPTLWEALNIKISVSVSVSVRGVFVP